MTRETDLTRLCNPDRILTSQDLAQAFKIPVALIESELVKIADEFELTHPNNHSVSRGQMMVIVAHVDSVQTHKFRELILDATKQVLHIERQTKGTAKGFVVLDQIYQNSQPKH